MTISGMHVGICLVSVLVGAVSQVLLKKAALRRYKSFWAEYLNPLVIIAYGLFVGSAMMTMLAYRGIPLSLGAVLESTSYLYVTLFGVLIFHERFTAKRALALGLILAGIAVYAFAG